MRKYQKIASPYMRETEGPNRNKLIPGAWSKPEFDFLQDLPWTWTAKVDGTNVRIGWDGYRVEFGGRTDAARLHPNLVENLTGLFAEELFEQSFGEKPVTLFGEGYGGKIQKGGLYRPDMSFILFDVWYDERTWWGRENVEQLAKDMGLDVVPVVYEGPIRGAIDLVSDGLKSQWGDFREEGLVGTPAVPLLARSGERVILKIKDVDFYTKA